MSHACLLFIWAVLFLWFMEYSTNCLLVSHPLSACYLHELWGGGGGEVKRISVNPLLSAPTHGVGEGRRWKGPIFRLIPPVSNTLWFEYCVSPDIISDFRFFSNFSQMSSLLIPFFMRLSTTFTYMILSNKNAAWKIKGRKFHPRWKGYVVEG
jgi:hypothetical protein